MLEVGTLEENRERYENAYGVFVKDLTTPYKECVKEN